MFLLDTIWDVQRAAREAWETDLSEEQRDTFWNRVAKEATRAL